MFSAYLTNADRVVMVVWPLEKQNKWQQITINYRYISINYECITICYGYINMNYGYTKLISLSKMENFWIQQRSLKQELTKDVRLSSSQGQKSTNTNSIERSCQCVHAYTIWSSVDTSYAFLDIVANIKMLADRQTHGHHLYITKVWLL